MAEISRDAILARLNKEAFFADYVELPARRSKPEVQVMCCFHPDKNTPSLGINLETGFWRCYSPNCPAKKGDIFTFYQLKHGVDFKTALQHLADKAGLVVDTKPLLPPLDPAIVDRCHEALLAMPSAVKWLLEHRGITLETITSEKIGWDASRKRYTLPVFGGDGSLFNIRVYAHKMPAGYDPKKFRKMLSWETGYGSARLYPADDICGDEVVLCEGEWDCLLARQAGMNAFTGTAGAGTWLDHWTPRFRDKTVTIMYDADDSGKVGAEHVAERLVKVAKVVRIATLPLPGTPVDKDVSDFILKDGHTVEELWSVVESAEAFRNGTAPRRPQGFHDLIPVPSFIDTYCRYCADINDAPPEYHFATAMTVLAAALGNRIWIHNWGQNIYPNIWSVLLAPSSFFRKSTALRVGLKLLESEMPEAIMPSSFSSEGFLDQLAETPGGVIPAMEFDQLLKVLAKDYNSELKSGFTALYDGDPQKRRTKKAGVTSMGDPAISIAGASTIDWLQDCVSHSDLRGGFLARFIFWTATERQPWPDEKISYDNPHIRESLTQFLWEMKYLEGEVKMSDPQMWVRFNKWVREHEHEALHNLPPELTGFYVRLTTYVLKFAMIFEVARNQSTTVSPESLDFGIRLAEYLRSHLVRVISEDMAITREARELKMVLDIIRREGLPDKSRVMRLSKLLTNRLQQVLDTLAQSGRITTQVVDCGSKRKVVYKAVEESE